VAAKLPSAPVEKPREQRTLREEMDAHEARVETMRVESDVRQVARKHGASVKALEDLVQRARCVFRIVDGRAVPVADGGRTVLRSADGSRALSVEEWTRQQVEKADGFARRGPDAGCEDAAMPARNPFKRKFWNLTEQMRLRKSDPEFAAKLKAEAWKEEG
jgi:uncharacterized protein involved in type VI secretion and phage assembly